MAKADRRLSFVFPSVEDKERWRKLAEPLTLTQWIWLKVEASLEKETAEQTSAKPTDSETVNRLLRANLDLKKENESLWESLDHFKTELEQVKGSPLPLDKDVVDLLRRGGSWTSIQINTALKTNAADDEALRAKSIEKTIETLEGWELVKRTWQGLKWNK